MNSNRCILAVLALTALVVADSLAAQGWGGRRGPPPEVKERWGNYFTTIDLPDGGQEVKELKNTDHVTDAASAGHLSVIYLYDSTAAPKKQETFEPVLFNHAKIQPGLRLYKCGRFDLSTNRLARERYGKIAPLFFVFDKKGKSIGRVSMKGFKPAPVPLARLLQLGSKGYSRVSFDNWVKSYSKWLRDLTNMDARQKALDDKRDRLDSNKASDRKKLAKVTKDEDKLRKRRDAHYDGETKLLERAKIPPRDADAVLVGERRRRGR